MMKNNRKGNFKFFDKLLLITLFSFAIRVGVSFPSLFNASNFLRLDSGGFIPGMMSFDWGARAPFYSGIMWIFQHVFDNFYLAAAIFGIICSSASVFIIGLIGRELSGEKCGLIAAVLLGLNVTSIGVAPLILSDTFFAFAVGLQILFAVKFYRNGGAKELLGAIVCGCSATLIRSINLPIMLISMPILILLKWQNSKKSYLYIGLNYLILLIFIIPFAVANFCKNAGFTIEYNAPKALIHNKVAIIAHAENRPSAEILDQEMSQIEDLIENKKLSIAERNEVIVQNYLAAIKKYPYSFAVSHFPNIFIMTPDLPSFCENLGVTSGDKGTLSVIRKEGIVAGIKHYFGEQATKVLVLALPLLLVTMAGYVGCLIALINCICRREYKLLIIWLLFSLLYVIIPGPIIMPRYQLAALFLIFGFAGGMGRVSAVNRNCDTGINAEVF